MVLQLDTLRRTTQITTRAATLERYPKSASRYKSPLSRLPPCFSRHIRSSNRAPFQQKEILWCPGMPWPIQYPYLYITGIQKIVGFIRRRQRVVDWGVAVWTFSRKPKHCNFSVGESKVHPEICLGTWSHYLSFGTGCNVLGASMHSFQISHKSMFSRYKVQFLCGCLVVVPKWWVLTDDVSVALSVSRAVTFSI